MASPKNRNNPAWITSIELARRAGISRVAASKALRRAEGGKTWNGVKLRVRTIFGRGGMSGKSREVLVRSLPEAFRNA